MALPLNICTFDRSWWLACAVLGNPSPLAVVNCRRPQLSNGGGKPVPNLKNMAGSGIAEGINEKPPVFSPFRWNYQDDTQYLGSTSPFNSETAVSKNGPWQKRIQGLTCRIWGPRMAYSLPGVKRCLERGTMATLIY